MTDLKRKPYVVIVRDNFHYMDASEQYQQGEYDTRVEALCACVRIVEDFLYHHHERGMSAEKLFDLYVGFGEDPFIVGPGKEAFSAWLYAKQRCSEICEEAPPT